MKRSIRGAALALLLATMALAGLAARRTRGDRPAAPTSSPRRTRSWGGPPHRIVIAPGGAPAAVASSSTTPATSAAGDGRGAPARRHPGRAAAPPAARRRRSTRSSGRRAAQSGSFAFQVEPGGASPALVSQPQPDNSLTPVREALPEWFAFAFIFIFIGTLALRFLVTRPTIARLGGRPQLAAAVDRRLLLTAGRDDRALHPGDPRSNSSTKRPTRNSASASGSRSGRARSGANSCRALPTVTSG